MTPRHSQIHGAEQHRHGHDAHHQHAEHHHPAADDVASRLKDPVCGMMVDPHTTPASGDARRPNVLFLFRRLPTEVRSRPVPLSLAGTGEERRRADAGGRRLHLPDAPGGAAERAGLVPDLRHGAGAGDGDGRRGPERRARRYDAAVLDRPGADRPGVFPGDGRAPARPDAGHRTANVELAAARARHAGRALGGLAVLRARLAVAGHAPAQHVHADRARHRRRLDLQHGGDARPWPVSGGAARTGRRHPGLLRGGGGDHRAGAAGPGAGTAGPRGDERRHPRASRPCAEDGAAHSPGRRRGGGQPRYASRSAIISASAPARRCRWMAR